MVKYHANVSPRALSTVTDPLAGYPAYWELKWWYLCGRKYPYSEIVAAIVAEERGSEYSHYPCPVNPEHWHIGRGGGGRTYKQQIGQAKRSYRKAVRDEIWREHVVRQEEKADA